MMEETKDGSSSLRAKTRSMIKPLMPRIRETRVMIHLFRRNLLGMIGLTLIIFVVLIALFAPWLAPPLPGNAQPDPYINRFSLSPPQPPQTDTTILGNEVTFIFGSGQSGEDVYYGSMWGARISIYTALIIVGISAFIGIVLGALAGFYGGAIDELIMRITDVFLSIPSLILALAIVAVLGKSLDNIILALIITWWPGYARLVRGQILTIKESTFVEAAKAVGSRKNRILFRHVVPNSISPLTVQITMDMGSVVLVAAALSFIGFSTPGLCDWGRMVSSGANLLFAQVPYPFPDGPSYNPWWAWVFPAIFIFIFVMGFNLLGDAMRDILDPRARR